ncbi:uncharacterized protein F5Z01DRAFT_170823 [Emericellopsis atlantica]|uniref:Fumarylacetoacetase-like C-terminal domain-containing protein n=1 Tax=Emericellopsis atlantica TaxID=2614577 RepID=A0A9P7ZK75_9HYPO|nr:uncharacterized protein F5Z01DRAFT_170823 [Emericellopsis atlantica]KAG9253008.1 hypothetical protein F5Z01DRAFT_170823 [Emericellopsis atlantica]
MGSVPATWSRFVRFISTDDRQCCGEPVDENVDVGLAVASGQEVQVRLLDRPSAVDDSQFTGETATIKTLLSPLSATEVGTVRCIGLNFKDHAAELNCPLPTIPEVFLKPSTTITNPSAPIFLPSSAPDMVDAEVELAIVIAEDCKNVKRADAQRYILGYTAANDVTARDVQGKTSQWGYSKGFDGFCPLGPCIVRKELIADINRGVTLKSTLNGEVLQDGTTDEFIFSVGEIVEHLSRDSTLPKGTVILTGTPSGIGHGRKPPRYLKAGSELQISISHGIGTLTNPVVFSSKM